MSSYWHKGVVEWRKEKREGGKKEKKERKRKGGRKKKKVSSCLLVEFQITNLEEMWEIENHHLVDSVMSDQWMLRPLHGSMMRTKKLV